MELIINQISLFVQGSLILEQFIFSLPLMIQFTLGIINELQFIAYINLQSSKKLFSTTSEMDFIAILSRPNTLLQSSLILSYIPFAFLWFFTLCYICFTYVIKSRTQNLVIELKIAFNTNIYFKVLFIIVTVFNTLIKSAFGYIILDVCFQTIQQNINDPLQVSINLITIFGIFSLIIFFTKMFSYNWAFDFEREHLTINESNLTYFRCIIKLLQLSLTLYSEDNQIFRISQLLLPIISSFAQIYQMQKLKQLTYNCYYKIILAINLIIIIICLQYLIHELFPQYKIQEIWILLFCLPFYYFQNQIQMHLQQNFLDFQYSSLENCNFVLFHIVQDIRRQKNIFKSQIVYLMFVQRHARECNNIECTCKQRFSKRNFEQISYEIYFQELLAQFERQIITMQFKFTQDKIILIYLQLLFLKKQYLIIYQYFQVIFEKSNRVKMQNQILMLENQNLNKIVFKIDNLHKIIVLKVAQDLMRLEIAQQLAYQKNSGLIEAQKNQIAIQEYLQIENDNQYIKQVLSQVLQFKLNFLEKVNSNMTKSNLEKLAYESIQNQLDGLKKLKVFQKNKSDQKAQNVLQFYQMEILNDMISSQNNNSSSSFTDEINFKMKNEFLKYEFSNMIVQINNKYNIKIQKCKYNQQDKIDKLDILNFQDMIPNYIQVSHLSLIENFIAGKQNKFYQQIGESHIQISPCLIKKINILMDLSQLNLNSIEMILFFSKKTDNQYSIFLNEMKSIINIDNELFTDILNIDGIFAQHFIGLDIKIIFENSDEYLYDQIYNQQTFYFLDPDKINLSYFIKTQQINIKSLWNRSHSMISYQCDLQLIKKKNEFGSSYFELIIKQPKRIQNNGETYISQFKDTKNIITTTPIEESVIVDKPFVIDQSMDEKLYSQQIIQNSEIIQQNLMQSHIQQDKQFITMKYNEEEQNISEQMDINTNKKKKNKQIIQKTDGVSSQYSALSAIQKSQYYRQFNLVNNLANSQKVPQIFKRIISFRIILTILSIVGFSLYFYQVDLFHHFQNDFKLLSMKNDIFYPILSFQLIRLSIVNYNIELFYKLITQQQFQELLKYPNSKLIGSFEKLKVGISNIIQEPVFFSLYHNQYLNLQFLQNGNIGETNELDLRNSLITLLNYQFDTQNAYIENGQAEYDSSYFYYSYKNLHTLINAFTEANTIAFDSAQLIIKDSKQKILIIFFILLFFFIMVQLIITLSHLLFQSQKEKLKLLLLNHDQIYLNLEIQRLSLLQELIDQNYNQIQYYKLNVSEKEEYFGKVKSICNQNSKNQIKVNSIFTQYYYPKEIVITLTHLATLSLIFTLLTIKIYESYQQIQQTEQLYQVFANLNIDVLSLYQSREILYYKVALPFLNQTDLDEYYIIAQNGLAGLEQYIESQQNFQTNNFFFDSEFFDLLDKFSNGNLCEELIIIDNTLNICNSTLGGALQNGFSSALVNIKNQMKTEFQDTNFTIRQNYPILELEGVTILSYGLQYLIENFYAVLFSYNYKVEVDYNIIIIICLCISILNGIILLKFDQLIQLRDYELLSKFIYSVPLASILFNDNFIRNTRSYFVNEKLI